MTSETLTSEKAIAETIEADPQFRSDVLTGLSQRQKAVPARWLYDMRGSELFEAITRLPEYYPTRTETALLENMADEVAATVGRGRAVVEFGAGSVTKTPLLLGAVDPSAFVPIDISGDFLRSSVGLLQQDFPALPIHPVEADFMQPISLKDGVADAARLGFFPGSTIGNMVPRSAVDLLRSMRNTLEADANGGAMLLIGFDRVKPRDILIPAYDDSAGVTAAFNLNLLERINRELTGDIPADQFVHKAVWNDAESRIEMHLEATSDVSFNVAGQNFDMMQGESIHTENSHKYGLRSAHTLLMSGGWTPIADWSDEQDWFSLILAEAQPLRMAP